MSYGKICIKNNLKIDSLIHKLFITALLGLVGRGFMAESFLKNNRSFLVNTSTSLGIIINNGITQSETRMRNQKSITFLKKNFSQSLKLCDDVLVSGV